MTDDDLERMRSRVDTALELKATVEGLTSVLVEWERRLETHVPGNYLLGSRNPLAGLSRAALCEIKRIAQTDLQKQIDEAAKKLADL